MTGRDGRTMQRPAAQGRTAESTRRGRRRGWLTDLNRGDGAVYVGQLAVVDKLLAPHVHLQAVRPRQQLVVELLLFSV